MKTSTDSTATKTFNDYGDHATRAEAYIHQLQRQIAERDKLIEQYVDHIASLEQVLHGEGIYSKRKD